MPYFLRLATGHALCLPAWLSARPATPTHKAHTQPEINLNASSVRPENNLQGRTCSNYTQHKIYSARIKVTSATPPAPYLPLFVFIDFAMGINELQIIPPVSSEHNNNNNNKVKQRTRKQNKLPKIFTLPCARFARGLCAVKVAGSCWDFARTGEYIFKNLINQWVGQST